MASCRPAAAEPSHLVAAVLLPEAEGRPHLVAVADFHPEAAAHSRPVEAVAELRSVEVAHFRPKAAAGSRLVAADCRSAVGAAAHLRPAVEAAEEVERLHQAVAGVAVEDPRPVPRR